jgi:hypothetical protein
VTCRTSRYVPARPPAALTAPQADAVTYTPTWRASNAGPGPACTDRSGRVSAWTTSASTRCACSAGVSPRSPTTTPGVSACCEDRRSSTRTPMRICAHSAFPATEKKRANAIPGVGVRNKQWSPKMVCPFTFHSAHTVDCRYSHEPMGRGVQIEKHECRLKESPSPKHRLRKLTFLDLLPTCFDSLFFHSVHAFSPDYIYSSAFQKDN